MKPTPFPWNPFGFIPNSVAHLFRPVQPGRKAAPPGSTPPPGPESQICLTKPRPGRAGQIGKARI